MAVSPLKAANSGCVCSVTPFKGPDLAPFLSRAIPITAVCMALFACGCGNGTGAGTGGGTGGGGTIPPPTSDFALSVSPASLAISAGGSAPVNVTVTAVNGFPSSVFLQVTGLPPGVTVAPSTMSVTPGSSGQFTFTANASAPAAAVSVTVTGGDGDETHSASLNLTIQGKPLDLNTRTRYVRTDAVTEYSLEPNSSWIVYDPNTKQFFFSDPAGNQITVMDATSESVVGSIPVPGAYGLDFAPDYSVLYAGTLLGDVYAINPVSMTVTNRYISSQIGAHGYLAYAVRALNDGRLVLFGDEPGYGVGEGWDGFAIWNPSDNSISEYDTGYAAASFPPSWVTDYCPNSTGVGGFTLSGDRTHVITGSIDPGGIVCSFDIATGQTAQAGGYGWGFHVAATPDGQSVLGIGPNPDGSGIGGMIYVYDPATLNLKSSFAVAGTGSSAAAMMVSPDSTTVWVDGGGVVYAYSIATGQLLGWIPNLGLFYRLGGYAYGPIPGPQIEAMDGTGLMAGPMEEGIGFLDTTQLQTGPVGSIFPLPAFLSPAAGPVAGGTSVTWGGSTSSFLGACYFGKNPATFFSSGDSAGSFMATTPAGDPGPVDVYTFMADGGMQVVPEGFSYGPTIVQATADSSTAEGGGTGIVYGYGFGPTNSAAIPPGLQITVGGQTAEIIAYNPDAYGLVDPPFPLEAISYAIPRGTAGTSSDIVVTSSTGTTTLAGGMHYLPALQQYALANASLAQGVYDRTRSLYYFTDTSVIQVFSRAQAAWGSPISLPAAPSGTSHRLWGIAISPDGSMLAVSDYGTGLIYVLDPDQPSSVQSFVVPEPTGPFTTVEADGLAITDSGMVYYATNEGDGDTQTNFHQLDTHTGAVTDYSLMSAGGADPELRTAVSSDGSRAYFNMEGGIVQVDTATETLTPAISWICCYGDDDISFAANQDQLEASSGLYDADLNEESSLTLNDREAQNITYVYGAKLSPDGSLLFQPSSHGIDVFDGRIGTLRTRIALPVALAQNFDALVSDETDNVLVGVTGQTGSGIAVIDLTSLAEPAPLGYSREAARGRTGLHDAAVATGSRSSARSGGTPIWKIRHAVNPPPLSRPHSSPH